MQELETQVNIVPMRAAQQKGLAMIHTRTVVGISALPVVVEVHLANGLPAFSTVGLPEAAVKESKDRVRGAILNSGFEFPAKRITVNLSPADIPKTGSRFDLPIAIGILAASGQIPKDKLHAVELIGELALDGQMREVRGVLPTALACGKESRHLIVPKGNASEAALAELCESRCAAHLLDVCEQLAGQRELDVCLTDTDNIHAISYPDLVDVKGQLHAKRALEIAATGGHSLIMVGPPGTGKSMLASRLPGILPELTTEEALQAAAIQSVAAGQFNVDLWKQRPFRSPHHSASSVSLVGGGSNPKPGEISMAHKGILFLDELTEFSRATLEQLREPMESGKINITRAAHSVEYPAEFQLVTACNPCPCGYLGDGTERCICSANKVENYRAKLSGPMLDRIDMHVHLPRVDVKTLQSVEEDCENSLTIKQRVTKVRDFQSRRQGKLNCQLLTKELEQYCKLNKELLGFVEMVCEKLNMSARGYHRVLKLARTIADMDGEADILRPHVAEALSYRGLDRR